MYVVLDIFANQITSIAIRFVYISVTTPPKQILDPKARLVEILCVPTALLHFGWDAESNTSSFLKPDCFTKLSSPSAAIAEAAKFR